MKKAINQTTFKTTPCDQFIGAAGEAKFDAVEACQDNIAEYLERGSFRSLRDQLESYDLQLAAINSVDDFNLCSDHDFKKRIEPQVHFMCEISYKLESDLIIASPSFLQEETDPLEVREDKIIAHTQRRLLEIAKIAGKNDIRVGLEFLGFPTASIHSLILTKKIVEPLAQKLENVGLVVDTFHFLISGCKVEDIATITPPYIVHVADLAFSPGDKLIEKKDTDRVFPGEGNFDFKAFLHALKAINYNGYFSVKILEEKLSDEPILDVTQRACNSLQSLRL